MKARIVTAAQGIDEAVSRLRAGKLVAFPTETVYGLGASALDDRAVAGIFAAKGRPSTNPLIVHVASADEARALASNWPPAAADLAARFWPGPLTLVVNKAQHVSDNITAGGPTVGLRVPAHAVALDLLREAGVPVAAPSANRSEEVSPTTAQHVLDSLGPFVDDLLILDGGPTSVGIESTVVDVTGAVARVLRPGMITTAMLRQIVGEVAEGWGDAADGIARSPGQQTRHYAPRASLIVAPASQIALMVRDSDGLLSVASPGNSPCPPSLPPGPPGSPPRPPSLGGEDSAGRDSPAGRTSPAGRGERCSAATLPRDPAAYAAGLYAALRALDGAGVERILVEEPPSGPDWAAVHDRLRRAAAPKREEDR